ncbi:MAG: hypothetical protein ACLRVN_03710 [Butyricicoccus sp.]
MRHGAEARVCDLGRDNFPLCAVSAVIYRLKGGLLGAGGAISARRRGEACWRKVIRQGKADWLRRAFGVLILCGGVRAVLLLPARYLRSQSVC